MPPVDQSSREWNATRWSGHQNERRPASASRDTRRAIAANGGTGAIAIPMSMGGEGYLPCNERFLASGTNGGGSVSTQQWQQLKVRDTGARVDIAIARPERRNSLDFDTWDELGRVMTDVAARDEVRVVTLTGEGDSFCAGVDFEWIAKSTRIELNEYPSFIRRWFGVTDMFERVAQPTLAAINGPAVGGGCELALACDLRIASERAVFAMPQMRMGVVPDVGGTSRLAKAAGSALAKDMILTGRVVDAEEALRVGIVSRVVPHDDLARVADEMAE